MIEPYNVTVIQPNIKPVFKGKDPFRRGALQENLDKASELVLVGARSTRSKLFVLPEFFLQGYQAGRSVDDWIEASIRIPGPETEQLGKVAREAKAYIVGMAYDLIDDFPGRFWNTAFIIDPAGDVVLKYRKVYAMTGKTRPGDVYDQYVAKFGAEGLFPVVDTPIGRLGALVCYDINFPEVTRCLALQGAEVLLHCTAEGRSPYHMDEGGWEMARKVRAYENLAYLAMANVGRFIDGEGPEDFSHGHSQIIDFNGRVLNIADTSNETMITAEIDIEALRRRRASPSVNFLAELNPQIHTPIYEKSRLWPTNGWADQPLRDVSENEQAAREAIGRMTEAGVLAAPANPLGEPVERVRPGR